MEPARATTAATTPAMNDGETAVAGEVGLGAGASAAEAMEMTAKRTVIVARSMVLVEAIEEGFEIFLC